MGYLLVTAVLVVTLGRLGDIVGRVRIYNLGFVVFTLASVALSFDPAHGGAGALWLIGWRIVQALGGSMLMANSAAILTDAFPAHQRGMALGINQIVGAVRAVHRPGAGRAAVRVGLARGVLGQRAGRHLRHGLGVPLAARDLRAAARPDRLVGQPHLRGRAAALLLVSITYGIQPLRRPHHGLDQPEGARPG